MLALLAWQTDWRQAAEAFRSLRWELWLLAGGLHGVIQVASSLRWQLLARPLGFQRPLRQLVAFYFIGMFFNLVLPTSVGGDVVRAWYLDNRSGRKMAAFLSVLLDRLSGLLVLLALGCGAVLLCPVDLPRWLMASVWGLSAAIVGGVLAMPTLARLPWLSVRYQTLSDRLAESLPQLLRPLPLLLSGVVQAGNVVLVWMLGRALGIPVADGYYWVLVPVVSLLTLLPISLNGMGIREGGTVLLLGLQGVGTGPAMTLALLWFALYTVVSLSGAAVYFLGSFPRFEVRRADQPVSDHSDQGRARQYSAAA